MLSSGRFILQASLLARGVYKWAIFLWEWNNIKREKVWAIENMTCSCKVLAVTD